jgi:hypothetical protein
VHGCEVPEADALTSWLPSSLSVHTQLLT